MNYPTASGVGIAVKWISLSSASPLTGRAGGGEYSPEEAVSKATSFNNFTQNCKADLLNINLNILCTLGVMA
jgi:hypothetical protein